MKKKLTVEIAEGLGNQIFMYAFAFSISKKYNYDLFIDNRSGYSRKKNLLRPHQIYMLDNFNIVQNIADNQMIFDTPFKRLKKKIQIFLDNFSYKKKFLIEKKIVAGNKKNIEKIINVDSDRISDNLYIQGNFENSIYFSNFKSELSKILTPKKKLIDIDNPLINKIKNSNSISLHIRKNRFSDQIDLKSSKNIHKSNFFTENIINYTNKSIDYINSKVSNPEYFIWSNDHNNINDYLSKIKIKNYTLVNNNVINDFNLFSYCKHFIVGPSSFHWWGAWLNPNPNKICIRPKNINPSNNKNFWPENWISI